MEKNKKEPKEILKSAKHHINFTNICMGGTLLLFSLNWLSSKGIIPIWIEILVAIMFAIWGISMLFLFVYRRVIRKDRKNNYKK